jgi:diacylglycerol kinase (ATP)
LGFWLKGFAMLAAYPFSSLTVRVDAAEHLATSVIVGKTHLYGGRYVITPDARLEEPLLDVVLFRGRRGIDYLRYMVGVIGGFHLRFKDVVHIKTDQLEVSSRQPIPYQVDGELAGEVPVTVGISPHTVRFLLPSLSS